MAKPLKLVLITLAVVAVVIGIGVGIGVGKKQSYKSSASSSFNSKELDEMDSMYNCEDNDGRRVLVVPGVEDYHPKAEPLKKLRGLGTESDVQDSSEIERPDSPDGSGISDTDVASGSKSSKSSWGSTSKSSKSKNVSLQYYN